MDRELLMRDLNVVNGDSEHDKKVWLSMVPVREIAAECAEMCLILK
jgi:hypothetical protein